MTNEATKGAATVSLERLLTDARAFGLAASDLQRAIARAADGRPIVKALAADACSRHFGCAPSSLGRTFPRVVVVVAGVRSGKSVLACAAALTRALTCDLAALMPNEVARGVIVAPAT